MENQKISISVEQLLLENGIFSNARLEHHIKNGVIERLDFSSDLPEGDGMDISIEPNFYVGGYTLVFKASDAGYALNTLGLFNNFNKGKLKVEGTFNENWLGKMHISIRDTHLIDAPVLFNLFSILSLDGLVSLERGVGFSSIQIPLILTEDAYTFNNLSLKGPSLNLRTSGSITKETKKIKASGQIVPISRLNELVSNIPLFGDIITGSQEGLLVADFELDGPLSNPSISTNPFSFITPGILKDVWGIVVGEDKKNLLNSKQPNLEPKNLEQNPETLQSKPISHDPESVQ